MTTHVAESVSAPAAMSLSIKEQGDNVHLDVVGDLIIGAGGAIVINGKRIYLNSQHRDLDEILEEEGVPEYARTEAIRKPSSD